MQNANMAASKECKNKYFFSTALARQKLIYFFPFALLNVILVCFADLWLLKEMSKKLPNVVICD